MIETVAALLHSGGFRRGFAEVVTFETGLKDKSCSVDKGEGTGIPEMGNND